MKGRGGPGPARGDVLYPQSRGCGPAGKCEAQTRLGAAGEQLNIVAATPRNSSEGPPAGGRRRQR